MSTTWYSQNCVPYAISIIESLQSAGPNTEAEQDVNVKRELLKVNIFKKDSFSNHLNIRTLLYQNLAEAVATFRVGDDIEKYTIGLNKMIESGDYKTGTNVISIHKCQVMTKLMLVERVATALGLDDGTRFVTARIPRDTMHSRLTPVVNLAKTWASACDTIQRFLEPSTASGAATYMPGLPSNPNTEQQAVLKKFDLLFRSKKAHKTSRFLAASGNIQLAAFMLSWLSTVS